jgi:hypothetical protein
MVNTETKPIPSSWEISLLWIGANALSTFGGILLAAFLNDILWARNLPPGVDSLINNPVERAFIIGLSIGGVKGLLERLILQRYEARWKGWVPVSMLAWAIAVTIAAGLPEIRPNLYINELFGGIIIGVSQWIILKHYLPKAYWWTIAAASGSFAVLGYIPLGYTFIMMLESFIAFIIPGLFMGILTGTTLSWLLNLSWLKEQ